MDYSSSGFSRSRRFTSSGSDHFGSRCKNFSPDYFSSVPTTFYPTDSFGGGNYSRDHSRSSNFSFSNSVPTYSNPTCSTSSNIYFSRYSPAIAQAANDYLRLQSRRRFDSRVPWAASLDIPVRECLFEMYFHSPHLHSHFEQDEPFFPLSSLPPVHSVEAPSVSSQSPLAAVSSSDPIRADSVHDVPAAPMADSTSVVSFESLSSSSLATSACSSDPIRADSVHAVHAVPIVDRQNIVYPGPTVITILDALLLFICFGVLGRYLFFILVAYHISSGVNHAWSITPLIQYIYQLLQSIFSLGSSSLSVFSRVFISLFYRVIISICSGISSAASLTTSYLRSVTCSHTHPLLYRSVSLLWLALSSHRAEDQPQPHHPLFGLPLSVVWTETLRHRRAIIRKRLLFDAFPKLACPPYFFP